MYIFTNVLDEEIRDQKALLRKAEKLLANAPEGFLKSRPRKNGTAFYQGGGQLGRSHVKNITGDSALVDRLLQKKLCQEIQRRASKNLQELERMRQSYEPNFTFDLPNGEKKIGEHFGMLDDMNSCIHNAHKLNTYQKHGFLIGRNLIITQDDQKGNCSSSFIDKMIQTHLLPYYR